MSKRNAAIIFLLIVYAASAATISGTAYNADALEPQDKAIVEINTVPKQVAVAADGEYTFIVPVGSYSLAAKYYKDNVLSLVGEENISVVDEGTYRVDIIMFQPGEFFSDNLENFDSTLPFPERSPDEIPIIVVILAVIGAAVLVIRASKRKKPEKRPEEEKSKEPRKEIMLSKDLRQIIDLLEKNGGIMTQLELRKHFPYSEAKVSLLVADLEDAGLVKKIKRGRGNIIKLLK